MGMMLLKASARVARPKLAAAAAALGALRGVEGEEKAQLHKTNEFSTPVQFSVITFYCCAIFFLAPTYFIKDLFGSYHLGLESRNSFVILKITCLAATELVTEFILNSMIFIPCLILIPMWYPVISVVLPNEMMGAKRALKEN
jgi:hypothetical protein